MGVLYATVICVLMHSQLDTSSWPQWRGPNGAGVSHSDNLPLEWGHDHNIVWKIPVPGEGTSSPIVTGRRIVLTYSLNDGVERHVLCVDADTGARRWDYVLEDEFPEITSSLTGWAAATPATDGSTVVAMFGNAGMIALDIQGKKRWHRSFGYFESELGLASSPVIKGSKVYLVADHDGSRFNSFDSFLIAMNISDGHTVWKIDRRGKFRSWSTPMVVSKGDHHELVVSAQDEVNSYDLGSGTELWRAGGNLGWVAPSPVVGEGLLFATSGRNGPTLAIRLGGQGDVTKSHLAWSHNRGAPYVCSPLFYEGRLWVHNEHGVLTCYRARNGEVLFRQRLRGKFTASAVAGNGRIYITSESGTTIVIRSTDTFHELALNSIGEPVLASAGFDGRFLLFRSESNLYKIGVDRK